MTLFKSLSCIAFLCLLTACGGSHSSLKSASSSIASSKGESSSIDISLSSSSAFSQEQASSINSTSSLSESSSASSSSAPTFLLHSNSFELDSTIPGKYTCDGVNVNPQLGWQDAPLETKSFVLIADDPDALARFGLIWVHWNVYNINTMTTELTEGASTHADLMPSGSVEATNDFGSAKYQGPCPPSGRHRYMFTIYALNIETVSFTGPLTRDEFEAAHIDNIIGKATYSGYYR